MTGEGVCTPIADTKKGKDLENLQKALVFQLLLAVIVRYRKEPFHVLIRRGSSRNQGADS